MNDIISISEIDVASYESLLSSIQISPVYNSLKYQKLVADETVAAA